MDKIVKKEVKRLLKEKNYNEIFEKFGSKVYKDNVPFFYQYKEKRKLVKEGKYFDIASKYGLKTYKKYLDKVRYKEIKGEKGLASALLFKLKSSTRNFITALGLVTAISAPALDAGFAISFGNDIKENSIEYQKEIEENDKRIAEYAREVKGLNLDNDVQVIMKVMDDMWSNIQGYKNPEKNIWGFLELDLSTKEGYGVCRNFAADNVKKLNAINPKYNARMLTAYLDQNDSYFKIADIDVKYAETNDTIVSSEEDKAQENKENLADEVVQKIVGNHAVVLLDIPEDNLTLVIDPTNPGIGVYIDGRIIMLNDSMNGKEYAEMYSRELSTGVILKGSLVEQGKALIDEAKSYNHFGISTEEKVKLAKEKYGLEAQNEALNITRQKQKDTVKLAGEMAEKAVSDYYEEKDKTKEDEFNARITVKLDQVQMNKSTENEVKQPNQNNNIQKEIDDEGRE